MYNILYKFCGQTFVIEKDITFARGCGDHPLTRDVLIE